MSSSRRLVINLLFITSLIIAMLTSVASRSLAASGNGLEGIIRLSDRSLCYYTNPLFNKRVFPLVEFSSNGTPFTLAGNQLGVYDVPISTSLGDTIRITCESLVFQHTLDQNDLTTGRLDVTFANSTPLVPSIQAKFGGVAVRGVPPGATVSVSVVASDPNGDPLQYAWRATDGSASNTNTPAATWTLPNSRGLHFLYVLVSDGKGGYRERQLTLSTDGGVVPALDAFATFLPITIGSATGPVPAPVALAPSEHTPASDHFLSYSALKSFDLAPAEGLGGPLDSRQSACAYYRDIGAVGGCTIDGVPTGLQLTFAAWKQRWGFGVSSGEVSAKYANLADLNLQRDMHSLTKIGPRAGGGTGTDVASYVCNHPNPDADTTLANVRLGNNLVACVAFEYSMTQPYNGGQPFTKFLTFGPDGNLLLSVNLDGRGEKFLPGTCVACHGGTQYSGQYGLGSSTTPNLNAQFIPYDLDNYRFSTIIGFRRQDQEAALRALNQMVLLTGANIATSELINGWYPTPTSAQNDSFVPAGWAGHASLYTAVLKPSCRMCHVVLDDSTLNFNTYADFASYANTIGKRVCGSSFTSRYSYAMPNAKQTFDRFWTGISGTPAVDQPAKILSFLQAEGAVDPFGNPVTSCALPTWLP